MRQRDYKDKLTDAGEYHLGSNNLNTKYAESIMEYWKQMAMKLGGLDVFTKLCCEDAPCCYVYMKNIVTIKLVVCNLEIDADL